MVFYLYGLHYLIVKDIVAAFFKKLLFIWVCWVLMAAGELLNGHGGSSSLTRDQTQALCIGSIEF